MPGIARENYWFRRHEAVYEWIASGITDRITSWLADRARIAMASEFGLGIPADVARRTDRVVVDAGCGEGYGAQAIAATGARCVGIDLDAMTIHHVADRYRAGAQADDRLAARSIDLRDDQTSGSGQLHPVAANLDAFPLRSGCADLVVSLQVVEHLWDLRGFLAECLRVLRPGGELIISTPNRLTFSPGLGRGERPTNPFHVEEFDAAQLTDRVAATGFTDIEALGLRHSPRIVKRELGHGNLVAAQVDAIQSGVWPAELDAFVATVTAADFEITGEITAGPGTVADRESDALDLIIVARKPAGSST